MTAKRGSRASRPAKAGEWTIKHATRVAAEGWENLCTQQPGVMADLYDRLTASPRHVHNRERQGRLKGSLASVTINGDAFEQRQYELSGGGRVWYAFEDPSRVVWITKATARHPNETK